MTISACPSSEVTVKRRNYNDLDDDCLLGLIKCKRDRIALAELYERYRQSLGRFLQRGMHESKLTEEVYNDVMLTVWSKADSFRGESKVSTWIFGIAHRTRMTHTRRESRHTQRNHEDVVENTLLDNDHSMDEILHAALTELSDPHRAVVELAYFHGYNIAEISAIVDCPQNTVKTRLFHARNKLRIIIEDEQLGRGETKNYAKTE